MKLHRFIGMGLLWACLSLGVKAQDMDRVRQTIARLASPEMKGRGYIGGGDSLAAMYLHQQFQDMGLASRLQAFPMQVNVFPGACEFRINGKNLVPGADFIMGEGSPAYRGKLKVEVFDSTWLDTLSPQAWNKLQSIPWEKRALWVSWRHLRQWDRLPAQAREILARNALRVIIQPEKLIFSVSLQQDPFPSVHVLQSRLPKRSPKNVYLNVEAQVLSTQGWNVIARIPGTETPEKRVLVTAHKDHLGMMGPALFPGASDNASGTALLLELARYYRQNPPPCTLEFVAFGGEEAGLIGSAWYVRQTDVASISFVLNLDLMGGGEEGLVVINGTAVPRESQRLQQLNDSLGLLSAIRLRANRPNSDHYHFARAGRKAIFCFTVGSVKAYHDIYDTPETLPLTRFPQLFGLFRQYLDWVCRQPNEPAPVD